MTPSTILVRARNLKVRLGDADDVCIVRGEERVHTTSDALSVLAAFAHPRALSDVLGASTKGEHDWMELSSVVYQLVRAGVLVEPGAPDPLPRGFAQPPIHIAMLNDRARTVGFIDAVNALVREGDVVVDIGTGTGVLATVAARAGAAHVHAIESSAIADSAERVFATNGVADRVTVVRGRSTKVSLPARCDVLVTEMIGNDPLDEQLLDVVDDAKRRLLTPEARIIPAEIEIFALPVDVPAPFYERRVFTAERNAAWREMYGVDFSPLLSVRQAASQPFMLKGDDVANWVRVAPPVRLIGIDFSRPFNVSFDRDVTFTIERDVERLGILLAFRATLAPGITLSTLPGEVAPENHWRYSLWPSYERLAFARGASATIEYGYGRGTTTLSVRSSPV